MSNVLRLFLPGLSLAQIFSNIKSGSTKKLAMKHEEFELLGMSLLIISLHCLRCLTLQALVVLSVKYAVVFVVSQLSKACLCFTGSFEEKSGYY